MSKQKNMESPVFTEDNVWIASNFTIGNGILIGSSSIIAANSFVYNNIPPNSIAEGVLAKIIMSR